MNKSKALTAYLAGREPAPFHWATSNCGHFAAGFVALVEGRDPLAGDVMPATLHAARRAMRDAGGLEGWVSRALAREPISASLAQVGDVVLLPVSATDPEAQAVGLCCGEYAAAVCDDGTLTMHPMGNALAAWRVLP
ncbi:hypothetical protein WDZ92_37295 [Nostoc sp. NIES-2111]